MSYINLTNKSGSDIRNLLVQDIKKKGFQPDNAILLSILNDTDALNKFFGHIKRNHTTFSKKTKLILLKVMIRFQEEAVQESMDYITLWNKLNNNKSINRKKYRYTPYSIRKLKRTRKRKGNRKLKVSHRSKRKKH
jgi:hypothetical protein